MLPAVRESGLSIILEPGRSIVGPAGALVTRVVDVKEQPGGKLFVILDAGMTELIRPMLYNAYHRIEPVETRDGAGKCSRTSSGPLCESSDTLGKDRRFPRAGGRRPVRGPRRRRLRVGDGVELQPPHAAR